MTSRSRAGAILVHVAPLAVLLGLTFGPRLAGGWVWDDVYLVRDNRNLDSLSGLRVLLTHDLWTSAGRQPSELYHPIPMALMWVVSKCGGRSVVAFRAVNVALHAGCVLLFAAWMRRRGLGARGVVITSLMFAVHPLVTEPVMWITGSHDLLATLGCLVALWLFSRDAPTPLGMALAAVATGWAALCKEPYFVLPAILLAQAVVSGRGLVQGGAARVVMPASAVGVVLGLRHHLGISTGSAHLHASFSTLLIDYATIVLHYLRSILTFNAGATTESFRALSAFHAAGVLMAIAGMTLVVFARFRARAPGADVVVIGWAWFLMALGPHTIAAPVIGMYGNRYAYFPMMGLAAALLALGQPFAGRLLVPPFRAARWVAPLGVLTLVPFTAADASLWRDQLTLFGADLERNPDDPRALYHYGHAVLVENGCSPALPFFLKSTERDPSYGRAWHNVAGCLVDLRRYGEALGAAETAERLQPEDAGAAFNLAVARLGTGDAVGGRAMLARALRLDPNHLAAEDLLRTVSTGKAAAP